MPISQPRDLLHGAEDGVVRNDAGVQHVVQEMGEILHRQPLLYCGASRTARRPRPRSRGLAAAPGTAERRLGTGKGADRTVGDPRRARVDRGYPRPPMNRQVKRA